MSHHGKNSKDNKKVNNKTKRELAEMKMNTGNALGTNRESKTLGHGSGVVYFDSSVQPPQRDPQHLHSHPVTSIKNKNK